MRLRLSGMVLLALILLSAPVLAAPKPTVILRMASVDTLSAKGKYLAKLIEQSDLYEQAEGFLKAFTGPKGVEGLDTTKPLGVYGNLGPNGVDSEVVVLIPVTDGEKFVEFLKKQNVSIEKQKNGNYKVDFAGSPLPGFLRFANGYGYLTVQNEEAIDAKNLLDPKTVLPANEIGLVSALFDMEQIPAGIKALMLQGLEDNVRMQKDNLPPNLDENQKKAQIVGIDLFANLVKSVIDEGGILSLGLDLDETSQEARVGLGFSGKPNSALAKGLADLGNAPSVAAATVPGNSILSLNLNTSLPTVIRDLLVAEAEKGIKKGLSEETDPRKKQAAQAMADGVMPTLKAGNIDLALSLVPTATGKHNLVVAAQVAKGSELEKSVKTVVGMLQDNEKRALGLTIDLDKVGGTNIHGAQASNMDANGKRLFGEGTIHFAVREDALLLSFGEGSLGVVRSAVDSKPRQAPIASASLSVGKILSLLPPEQAQRAEPIFKKVLGGVAEGKDTIRATLKGGKELKLDLTLPAPVIQLLGGYFKLQQRGA